jgi:hypothetical protein
MTRSLGPGPVDGTIPEPSKLGWQVAPTLRQPPRLEQAIENIAWMTAHDEADYGRSKEEHQ